MENNSVKKKRTLKNIDFSKEDSHIALVGPAVGGPASGADYALVMKAVSFSEEAIEKMQSIKVTMSVPDFLRKFFGLYYEDAEVLARVMGYVPPESDESDSETSYEDWIQSKVDSFEILKSLQESTDVETRLSELDEEQYMSFMLDQETIEKALKKYEKDSKATAKPKARVKDASPASEERKEEASASGSKPNVEKSMTKTIETEVTVEMVEKSALEDIQKSLTETMVELQKAKDEVNQFRKERAEAIRKSRFDALKTAVKDEAKAEVLFKAVSLVEKQEDFDAVVKVLAEMNSAVEKSALFEEKGASAETTTTLVKENPIVKALRAQKIINEK